MVLAGAIVDQVERLIENSASKQPLGSRWLLAPRLRVSLTASSQGTSTPPSKFANTKKTLFSFDTGFSK